MTIISQTKMKGTIVQAMGAAVDTEFPPLTYPKSTMNCACNTLSAASYFHSRLSSIWTK